VSASPRSVVVVRSRSAVGLAALERFRAAGERIVAVDADLADALARRGAFEDAVRSTGSIDVLVLPGPDEPQAPAWPAAADAIARADTALRTAYFCTRDAARHMTGGRIVLAVPARSRASVVAPATLAEGAFAALVRLLAVELAPRSIAVNGLCPIEPDVAPDAIADALAFLASPDASYLTGASLPMTGR
jgi:NAD(P)-dependent dehydrogenase (short-subunit alcohol dehydrogenase family)